MTLGSDFKYAHLISPEVIEKRTSIRRVRTAAGMKVFKRPIGTIITRRMYEEAKRAGRLGDATGGGGGNRGGGGNAGGRAAGAGKAAAGRAGGRGGGGKGGGGNGGQKAPDAAPSGGRLGPKGQKYARQIGNKLDPRNVAAVEAKIDNDKSLTPKERAALKDLARAKKAELGGKKAPKRPEGASSLPRGEKVEPQAGRRPAPAKKAPAKKKAAAGKRAGMPDLPPADEAMTQAGRRPAPAKKKPAPARKPTPSPEERRGAIERLRERALGPRDQPEAVKDPTAKPSVASQAKENAAAKAKMQAAKAKMQDAKAKPAGAETAVSRKLAEKFGGKTDDHRPRPVEQIIAGAKNREAAAFIRRAIEGDRNISPTDKKKHLAALDEKFPSPSAEEKRLQDRHKQSIEQFFEGENAPAPKKGPRAPREWIEQDKPHSPTQAKAIQKKNAADFYAARHEAFYEKPWAYLGEKSPVPEDISPDVQALVTQVKKARDPYDLDDAHYRYQDLLHLGEIDPATRNYLSDVFAEKENQLGLSVTTPQTQDAVDTLRLMDEAEDYPTAASIFGGALYSADLGTLSLTDSDVNLLSGRMWEIEQQAFRDWDAAAVDVNPEFKPNKKDVKPPVGPFLTPEGHENIHAGKPPNGDPDRRTKKELEEERPPAYVGLIEDGKTIEEVVLDSPDGLVETVVSHPERFKIKMMDEGQGGAMSVWDKKNKKMSFLKQGTNGVNENGVFFNGDVAAEVISGKFGKAAFPQYFLDANYASSPDEQAPWVHMEHADELGEVGFFKNEVGARWDIAAAEETGVIRMHYGVQRLEGKSALAVHIFDYLTNQKDRHYKNYGILTDEDGYKHMVAIDNGAAFNSFSTYGHSLPESRDVPEDVIMRPEAVGYEEWNKYYSLRNGNWMSKGKFVGQEVSYAYNGNQAQLMKDAEEIIEVFRGQDLDSIMDDLFERFPDLDDYESSHIIANIGIIKSRLQNITPQSVAKVISQFDAFREGN